MNKIKILICQPKKFPIFKLDFYRQVTIWFLFSISKISNCISEPFPALDWILSSRDLLTFWLGCRSPNSSQSGVGQNTITFGISHFHFIVGVLPWIWKMSPQLTRGVQREGWTLHSRKLVVFAKVLPITLWNFLDISRSIMNFC